MNLLSTDPWDEFRDRMRKDPVIGPFFADIDREFERLQESFQRMLSEAGSARERAAAGDPFVYGFSFKMGPDGRPVFQQFGNAVPRVEHEPDAVEGAREPLVDVIAHENTVSITAELPGVDKKDVKVRAAEDALTVRVEGGRRYFKRIPLPVAVKPGTTKATYKNGVLDVEIERKAPAAADEGTDVPVE